MIKVEIKEENGGFQLYRGGKAYYIKGAVYWANPNGKFPLDYLRACGGNSVRCGGRYIEQILDEAYRNGLTVTVGLPFRGEYTSGFDYGDEEAVKRQFERIKRMVLKLKDVSTKT